LGLKRFYEKMYEERHSASAYHKIPNHKPIE
jgi:hypothetical protein